MIYDTVNEDIEKTAKNFRRSEEAVQSINEWRELFKRM